jgi:DNA polymerase-1
MKSLIFDIEANHVDPKKVTNIWCICTEDPLTGTKKTYKLPNGDLKKFFEDIKEYDRLVGHNIIGYDIPVLKEFFGIDLGASHEAHDTLVMSRLFRPTSPYTEKFGKFNAKGWDNRVGGHALGAWGARLGNPKIDFHEFDRYSEEMVTYCEQDVSVNVQVYKTLLKEQDEFGISEKSLELEQESHKILTEQTANGFKLHQGRAVVLLKETEGLLEEYHQELHKIFPPKKILTEEYSPRVTKDGELYAAAKRKLLNNIHEEDPENPGTYRLYVMQEFNPSSPQQVGQRLMDIGWKPRKFTATGQPSTSKDTIGEAIDFLAKKFPEVEVLRKYNIVADRNAKAKKWLELSEDDGRVHGRVNHIGPWTHRSSHFNDNMANIASVQRDPDTGVILKGLEGDFGWDSRDCWIPEDGWTLIGCDASGIQLRALAHYMNDPDYIKELISGDIHVTNQKAAGIIDRPTAKTFIYAWLLGAGDEKIGMICGIQEDEYDDLIEMAKKEHKWNHHRPTDKAKHNLLWYVADKLRSSDREADKESVCVILKGYYTKKKFLESLPALKKLREIEIPAAAKKGFMKGLDGRTIWVPSEHLAMGAYLQGFEAVVMKEAMCIWNNQLKDLGIPYRQVAYVHDEWQIETPPEHADTVGSIVAESIKQAGVNLGSRCPLEGEYIKGSSWADCH